LNGYKDATTDIPAYRHVVAEVKAFNPQRGWIPMWFQDSEMARAVRNAKIENPIAEIEEMSRANKGRLIINFTPEMLNLLMRDMNEYNAMMPRKFIAPNSLTGIVDKVRTTILEWALKLEKEGILGEGMTFSDDERKRAAQNPSIHINTFNGVLGDVNGGQLQIGNYGQFHQQLKDAGVSQSDRNEIETIIDELPKAEGAKKAGLVQRGMDWVGRNASNIGEIGGAIRKVLTTT
jgi:AbiTii